MFGQSLQKHGDVNFNVETLREMTVQIWALKFPEMTLSVHEFKIHKVNGILKREHLQTTKFYFYHDPDEDFATKLQLTTLSPRGDVISCKQFSQFSSYNASYNDDGNYLNEGDYIFDDVGTEDIYKNEDLSVIFKQEDFFDLPNDDSVGDLIPAMPEPEDDGDGGDSLSLSSQHVGDEDILVPGSDFGVNQSSPLDVVLIPASPEPDDGGDSLYLSSQRVGDEDILVPGSNFNVNQSSPPNVIDLIPASPEPGDRFKDLLSEPLLYDLD